MFPTQNVGERYTFQNNAQFNENEGNLNILGDLSMHSDVPINQNMEAFNNPFQNQDPKLNFADDDNLLEQNQKNQEELQSFMQQFAQFNIQPEQTAKDSNEKKSPQLKVQTKFEQTSPAFLMKPEGIQNQQQQVAGFTMKKNLDITVNASFGAEEVDENQIYDDINQLKEKVVEILQQYNTKMSSKENVQTQEIQQDVKNIQSQYTDMLNRYNTINQTQQMDYTILNPQQSFMNYSYLKTGGPKEDNINNMIQLVEDFLGQFSNEQQQSGQIVHDPNDYEVLCIYCSQKVPYYQLQQHSEICKQQNSRNNCIMPSLTQQRNSIVSGQQKINIEKVEKLCEKIKIKANKLNDNPLAQPIYQLMVTMMNSKQNNQLPNLNDYTIRVKNFINKINQQYLQYQFLPNAEVSLLALLNKLYNFLLFPQDNINIDEITNSSDKSGQKLRNQMLKHNQLASQTKIPVDAKKLDFFNLVIETKKEKQIMKKFCLISQMYQQIVEKDLPRNNWKEFVEQQLETA